MLCDTEVLATLPPRECRCGLGELAKYHWLGGGELDALPLDERVAACVRIKADVVAVRRARGRAPGDPELRPHPRPRDRDRRRATTSATARRWRSVWCTPPSSRTRLGRIDDAAVAEHRRVVAGYDLPSTVPDGLDDDELLDVVRPGQEGDSTSVTFVLDGPDGVEVVTGVPDGRSAKPSPRCAEHLVA